jgi:hypothetical protein
MKPFNLFLIIVLIGISFSCKKDTDVNLTFDKINGYVQKGPYLNGTAIDISELSVDLTPTGKIFSSQIVDNKGTFEIKNVVLSSEFVELEANGFYFDEVKNSNSTAPLTLLALSDLTDKTSLNINVLSSLEKRRVEYLIGSGKSFSEAKKQAQAEILNIFEMEKADMIESELLDISQSGDDNAMLLAVSVILQGYLSVSELSELLANISTDIREDGLLDSGTLGSILINNAKTLKLGEIRSNLESRYESLGLNVTIPDFEKYVNQFIENTGFEYTGGIKYPESGKFGVNILDRNKTVYPAGNYSMKAILPEGTNLKVKIIDRDHWAYPAFQVETGWNPSSWNSIDNSRAFTSTRSGDIDFEIRLMKIENTSEYTYPNKIDIEVYEDGVDVPTWVKEIKIE